MTKRGRSLEDICTGEELCMGARLAIAECKAVEIVMTNPLYSVPGMLQTPAFTRGRLNVARASAYAREKVMERRRLRTRNIEHGTDGQPPPELHAVISESLLRRLRGANHKTGREQLGHLAAAAEWPNVHLYVAPVSSDELTDDSLQESIRSADPLHTIGLVEPAGVWTTPWLVRNPQELAAMRERTWQTIGNVLGETASRQLIQAYDTATDIALVGTAA